MTPRKRRKAHPDCERCKHQHDGDKRQRQLWRELGRCVVCGKRDAREGWLSCQTCADRRNRTQRARVDAA